MQNVREHKCLDSAEIAFAVGDFQGKGSDSVVVADRKTAQTK